MLKHMKCYSGRYEWHGILLLAVLVCSLMSQCWCEGAHCSENHCFEEPVSDVGVSHLCDLHLYDEVVHDSSRENDCQVCKSTPLRPSGHPKRIDTVPEGKDKRYNPLAVSSAAILTEACFQASKPSPFVDANEVSNSTLTSLRSVIMLA